MGYGYGNKTSHNFAREKGVQKVFTNDMVIHVWAQQSQSEGRSGNGNISFSGEWLYSYRTAIARFITAPSGEKIALIRDETFSVSTSQHTPGVGAIPGRAFCVPFIGSSEGSTRESFTQRDSFLADNMAVFSKRFADRIDSELKRSPHTWEKGIQHVMTSAHWMTGVELETHPLPRSRDSIVAVWRANFIADLIKLSNNGAAYALAFGLAWPLTPAKARKQAEKAASAALARFESALFDPAKMKARQQSRARATAKHFNKARVYAYNHAASLWAWLNTAPDICAVTRDCYGPSVQTWRRLYDDEPRSVRVAAKLIIDQLAESFPEIDESAVARHRLAIKNVTEAQRRAVESQAFDKWQAGETISCPSSYQRAPNGGVYLRIKGDELQTSQGASVPLAHAIRVFKFAKAIREKHFIPYHMEHGNPLAPAWRRNGSTVRVGHFQLDEIYPDGSFKAGCHLIKWEQIESAARVAGVIDQPGDDSAIEKGSH